MVGSAKEVATAYEKMTTWIDGTFSLQAKTRQASSGSRVIGGKENGSRKIYRRLSISAVYMNKMFFYKRKIKSIKIQSLISIFR